MSVAATAEQVDVDLAFKALSLPQRREILAMLSEAEADVAKTCCAAEEVCACKIADRLGLSASTTSHHMALLQEAGLVTARKQGLWTYYRLNRPALARVAKVLCGL
ncbi:MAG: metalloregulator ArsR/SmtB family transcription factor [Coriobacteriales bacterium]|nr:metalloregulator ArsR/SmtB family transcription factor [Actinomycetes bacterium]